MATRYVAGARKGHVFDIGLPEMMVIVVLVIVFFPPDDLPQLMRTLGRYYGKIRSASDDLRRTFNAEVARVDADRRREEMRRRREERERGRDAGDPEEPMILAPDPRLPPDAAPRRLPDAPPRPTPTPAGSPPFVPLPPEYAEGKRPGAAPADATAPAATGTDATGTGATPADSAATDADPTPSAPTSDEAR